MDILIYPRAKLTGTVLAPSSKSDAHRALICAALADSPSAVRVTGTSCDIEATVRSLCVLGARIERLSFFLNEATPMGTEKHGSDSFPRTKTFLQDGLYTVGAGFGSPSVSASVPCGARNDECSAFDTAVYAKTDDLAGQEHESQRFDIKPVIGADTFTKNREAVFAQGQNLGARESSIKNKTKSKNAAAKEGVLYCVTPITRAPRECTLDCGESGSTLRFLLPVAAALCQTVTFTGGGRLGERPMHDLCDVLRKNGCTVSADFLPITVRGTLQSGRYALRGDVSSQYISGLLFALPPVGGGEIVLTSVLESAPYVELTLQVMARFGALVQRTANGFLYLPRELGINTVHSETCAASHELGINTAYSETRAAPRELGIKTAYSETHAADNLRAASWDEQTAPAHAETLRKTPPRAGTFVQKYRACYEYNAEGDWSNAAFWLCARFLGADVCVTGLKADSVQGDRAVLDVLSRFTQKSELYVDCKSIPDLVPILAVTACARCHPTHFTGAARLRLKESDRIKAVCALVSALGGKTAATGDTISVYGNGALLGGTVDGMNDHRIVMAAAIASLLCTKPVTIRGAEAVNKSYPAFFDDFNSLGGNTHVIDIR